MYLQHLSSLQFLTYVAFFAVVVAALFKFVPGKAPPVRTTAYPNEELGAHDRKTAKYFVAGGFFLVLGSLHMVVKNLPWVAGYLSRTGYAGHLVRDLSNTHVMIVGGGTLLATGLCWLVLPRIVARPLASEGLAQCAFWFTAVGLAIFYVSLIGNGIAIGRLVEHGWDYQLAKDHMGKWYKVPTGMGAGIMGLGYWCFAAHVGLTVFQSRPVRVHEGRLVVVRGLTPEQAEEETPLHPFLIMGSGIAMFAAFWLLLAVVVRAVWRAQGPARPFVLAGCGALAVGTLQGPVQAFP